jgi:endonuclease YncB( thermonuclease family)
VTRRGRNGGPFSRDYRRPPRWGRGLPPRRGTRRPADPVRYLRVVIVAAAGSLFVLPYAADALSGLVRGGGQAGCRVVHVIDGDTVGLWCPARGYERARLLGFDTPELFSPGCAGELTAALAAKWRLRVLIWTAAEVRTVRSGEDRYGRALVSLILDGQDVRRTMIAEGHARPYAGGERQEWCA